MGSVTIGDKGQSGTNPKMSPGQRRAKGGDTHSIERPFVPCPQVPTPCRTFLTAKA
jgi:hypothetical protein